MKFVAALTFIATCSAMQIEGAIQMTTANILDLTASDIGDKGVTCIGAEVLRLAVVFNMHDHERDALATAAVDSRCANKTLGWFKDNILADSDLAPGLSGDDVEASIAKIVHCLGPQ